MTAEPDLSIARAWHAADEEWKVVAFRCVHWFADRGVEFTADDIWDAMEKWYPKVSTREKRAMGFVLRQSAREGLIVKVRIEESRRESRHKGLMSVWRGV